MKYSPIWSTEDCSNCCVTRFCCWWFWSCMSDIILHNNIIIMIKRIWHLSNDRLFMIQFTIQKIISTVWSISYGTFRMEHFLNLRNKFANGLGCSTCFDEPIPVDCPSVELWTLSISFYKKSKWLICVSGKLILKWDRGYPGKASWSSCQVKFHHPIWMQ